MHLLLKSTTTRILSPRHGLITFACGLLRGNSYGLTGGFIKSFGSKTVYTSGLLRLQQQQRRSMSELKKVFTDKACPRKLSLYFPLSLRGLIWIKKKDAKKDGIEFMLIRFFLLRNSSSCLCTSNHHILSSRQHLGFLPLIYICAQCVDERPLPSPSLSARTFSKPSIDV